MKKIILAVALMAAVSTSAVAENNYKPEAMSVATEINYSFGGASNEGLTLPDYGAKVRLFLNDNLVIRLNLGLGFDRTPSSVAGSEANYTRYFTNPSDPNDTKEYEETNKTSVNTFSIMPGFEYHFNKFDRISPYVGAEIGIRTQSIKSTTENDLQESKVTTKAPGIGFAVNAITGVDVYLCKGLYVGAELGLGYDMMKIKRGSTKTEAAGQSTETDGNISYTDTFFGFRCQPSLRIGWFF